MKEIEEIMEFYRHSNADIVCAFDGDAAGVVWTIPPCSPPALKQAIRQLVASNATGIQWMRKVRLNSALQGKIDAIAIYTLPEMTQQIFRFDTGAEVKTDPLHDECFAVAQTMKTVR